MTDTTIAGLARAGGVGVETVRYYQRRGLMPKPDGAGGVRRYGPSEIRRLRFIRAAQGDMMKGMHAPVPFRFPDVSFRLHAGDDQEARLGRVVRVVVAVVVGQRHKIIAHRSEGPQQLRRLPAPVGPGGVAVQRPAQQGKIRAESSLTVYHTLSILLIFIFAHPGGRKSLPVP